LEITFFEAILWAGSAGLSVDAVVEALVGNGAMEDVVEQGVEVVSDDLLSAALLMDIPWISLTDGRGLGLNHGYGEEEEDFAKLGENHFLAGGGG